MGPEGDQIEQQIGSENLALFTKLVEDLTPCITITHGYAQLLQRRIQRRNIEHPDELLTYLANIQRASRIMETQLRQFELQIGNEG